MSSPFTDTSTKSLQSLMLYNELQTAYSERRQALNQSAASGFAEDAFIQKRSMWTTWQNWVDTNCTSFLNYAGAVPLIDSEGGPVFFTLATFRAKAGLNADGFKRHYRIDRTTTATAYGVAQVDDYVGPWLIDELQAAFSVLRYSRINATLSGNYKVANKPSEFLSSFEAAYNDGKAKADAEYAAAAEESSNVFAASAGAWQNGYSPGPSYPVPYSTLCYKGTTAWKFVDNLGARGALLDESYLVLNAQKPTIYPGDQNEWISHQFDDGGQGITEGWNINETVIAGSGPGYTLESTFHDHAPLAWPVAVPYADYLALPEKGVEKFYHVDHGYLVKDRYWILKWNFTNI